MHVRMKICGTFKMNMKLGNMNFSLNRPNNPVLLLIKVWKLFCCFIIPSFIVFSLLVPELDICSADESRKDFSQRAESSDASAERDVLVCHFAHICRSQLTRAFYLNIIEPEKNVVKTNHSKPEDPYLEKPLKPPKKNA